MTITLPTVRIGLTLGPDLPTAFPVDEIERLTGDVLADLGIAAPVEVEVTSAAGPDEVPAVFRIAVTVNGRPLPIMVGAWQRAVSFGSALGEICALAIADGLTRWPSRLLPEVLDAAVAPDLTATDLGRLRAVLAHLMNRRMSVANGTAIIEAVQAAAAEDPLVVAENLMGAHDFPRLSVEMVPGHLRALTTSEASWWPAVRSLRTTWLTEAGVGLPPVHLISDSTLAEGTIRIRVNDLRTIPFPGIPLSELVVARDPEELRTRLGMPETVELRSTVSWAGSPMTLLPRSMEPELEQREIGYQTPVGHVVRTLHHELTWCAGSLISTSTVDTQLGLFAQLAPSTAARVDQQIGRSRLTGVFRALLDERVGIRNLAAVAEALIESTRRERQPTDADLVEAVRQALPYRAVDAARYDFDLPLFRLESSRPDGDVEPGDLDDGADLAAAGRALFGAWAQLPVDRAFPAVLAPAGQRSTTAQLFGRLDHEIRVVGSEERPPGVRYTEVGRLTLGAAGT